MSFAKEVWDTLSAINVNDHVQKKIDLSFLSWSWAWATLMDKYPESYYAIEDSVTAADGTVEVWVSLTVTDGEEDVTRRMWLPVMDHKNNAIKAPTTRQISDARMRCLVKCMAMFGLGHYLYAGEDLPSAEKDTPSAKKDTYQPSPLEEQVNACMHKDDLAALWHQMSDADKKAYKSVVIERGEQLKAEQ